MENYPQIEADRCVEVEVDKYGKGVYGEDCEAGKGISAQDSLESRCKLLGVKHNKYD